MIKQVCVLRFSKTLFLDEVVNDENRKFQTQEKNDCKNSDKIDFL